MKKKIVCCEAIDVLTAVMPAVNRAIKKYGAEYVNYCLFRLSGSELKRSVSPEWFKEILKEIDTPKKRKTK